jgi:FAD/FMN-containing dehydrogenase
MLPIFCRATSRPSRSRSASGWSFGSRRDVATLRDVLTGPVVVPGDDGWDAARQAWNLAVDQRPAFVALPESAADVQAIVDFARTRGLRVAMQGTGHSAAPLAPLAGSAPDVGIVGYTLGGGLSWLGRRYGLAANRLLSAEVVTADGRLVHTSRNENAELFWALRGGGGNFGAVVAIEFELIPMRTVYAGMLMFPADQAREVMQAWREWTAEVPDSVTTSCRIMNLPPLENIPEFLRGRSIVIIDGAICEDAARAEELLAPLRALSPEMDTFADMAPVGLSYIHMDPEDPMPCMSDSAILDGMSPEVIDAIVDVAGPGSGSPILMVELRHIGGALGRYAGGALSRFDGEYLYFAAGVPMDPAVVAALEAHFALVGAALAPHKQGRHYLNFAERATDPVAFYGEERYARLRRIKAEVDPLEIFRANHEIPAA